MFLMVPLSALLFRLVYIRHRRPYLHYLVFSLHLHALFYLTASVAVLVGKIPPDAVSDMAALIVLATFPINTVRAQRRTFGDGWGRRSRRRRWCGTRTGSWWSWRWPACSG